ncbi:hypothetical protein SERLADRAFT_405863 [Serpula lacrymans var. lacrymans S7.9]|uniref:Uncharacterized protein n=1 Tax=Serpula lacrymans var. lacrymans (strain S7.9) TaxID=578457 RepID=F8NJM1_SERL9|nr:uncharacterized protein SERLADRAFT_405863 [Serpula lacrymans var. lacrymans S7.9]EGO28236.1 hypothetical protein SERLADRAFT_405863 [Serpula lacrymans var. lacrymans S7.9]
MYNHLQQHADSTEGRLSEVTSNLLVADEHLQDVCKFAEDQARLLEESNSRVQGLHMELENLTKELMQWKSSRDGSVSGLTFREKALTSELKGTKDTLDQMGCQLSDITKSYQDTDSQRKSLCAQVTDLQSELILAKEELVNAQRRYGDLQAQHLLPMPSSDVTRNQIADLEMRVLRRTEQIGIHQHDIRRLETNLRLQDERVAEMASELETLGAQKDAMVGDCAEAREARDETLKKLETAELDLERMEERLRVVEEEGQGALVATISAFAATVTQSRITIRILQRSATQHIQAILQSERRVDELEKATVTISDEWHQRYKVIEADLEEGVLLRHSLVNSLKARDAELFQMTIALAATHTGLSAFRRQIHADVKPLIECGISPSECQLEYAMEMLSRLHADDPDELQAELKHLKGELDNIKSLHDDAELRCQQTREEAVLSLQELEVKHAKIQTDQGQQLNHLKEELCSASAVLETAQQSYVRLDCLHRGTVQRLAEVEDDYSRKLAHANGEVLSKDEDHEHIVTTTKLKLSQEIKQANGRVDEMLYELQQTQKKLREESNIRMRDREAHETEMQAHIIDTRKQLDRAKSELYVLQAEKHCLLTENTCLKAEIQKSLSLTRYLEGQIKESYELNSSLEEALDRIHLELDQSEKTSKAAEINLALQAAQHEPVLSTLHRELAALKFIPNLEEVVHELREKNREMDEILRNKCIEIEEYDDRILETLKVNKKLTAKVESKTRKIQNLQSKLAASKTSMVENYASDPKDILTSDPQLHSVPCASSLPVQQAIAPASFKSAAGTISAPTDLDHPTAFAERRVAQLAVFQTRTPEKYTDLMQSGPSMSKKRPAPDDDERNDVPPEGHYPEKETRPNHSNANVPRLRRALHMNQSGFTPVRNSASRLTTSSSPVRRITTTITTAMTGPHFISDVTNSPRAASGPIADAAKPSKRSWLGKIRGVPLAAHSISRASSSPHAFARMPEA